MRRLHLSWRIFNTSDSTFCINALEEAIDRFGPPDIFNTDQVSISMDGRGRCQKIFLESGYGGPLSTCTSICIHLKTAGRSVSFLPSGSNTTSWQEAIPLLTTKPRMRFTSVYLPPLPGLPDAYFFFFLRACSLFHPSGCPINWVHRPNKRTSCMY